MDDIHHVFTLLSDTLPSVARGLAHIRWNSGRWMTLKKPQG